MKDFRYRTALAAGAMLAFCLFFGASGASAQTGRTKPAPRFVGNPQERSTNFNNFIVKNVGKRVYLNLTFSDEPIGYKSGEADPFFNAAEYTHFFDCGERQNAEWTTRCRALNYDRRARRIAGYFLIVEPRPKTLRTNRSFDLIPVSLGRRTSRRAN